MDSELASKNSQVKLILGRSAVTQRPQPSSSRARSSGCINRYPLKAVTVWSWEGNRRPSRK